jgi:Ca2+-binding RTX toxin-like protein
MLNERVVHPSQWLISMASRGRLKPAATSHRSSQESAMLPSSLRKVMFAALALGPVVWVSSASAATVEVVDGTVVFSAAPGEVNDVRAGGLALPGPNLTITDSGAALTAGAGCEQIDGNTARCLESDEGPARPLMMRTGDRGDRVLYDDFRSRTVSIRGGGGQDTLHGGSSEGGPVEVLGDAGDDQVTIALNFGSGGVVRGGAGDDVVRAFESAGDQLFGDDGDDHLIHSACDGASALDGGTGNDTYTFDSPFPECSPPVIGGIVPGPGFDTLDQSPERFAALAFNFSDCPACVEAVLGTSFDDQISGDNNPQVIRGGDGNDLLDGGGGIDLLSGQGGDDSITSRDGRTDVVSCGGGTDSVTADPRDVVARDCESVTRSRA